MHKQVFPSLTNTLFVFDVIVLFFAWVDTIIASISLIFFFLSSNRDFFVLFFSVVLLLFGFFLLFYFHIKCDTKLWFFLRARNGNIVSRNRFGIKRCTVSLTETVYYSKNGGIQTFGWRPYLFYRIAGCRTMSLKRCSENSLILRNKSFWFKSEGAHRSR